MTSPVKTTKSTRKVAFAVILMVVIVTVPVGLLIHFQWQAAATAAVFGAVACLTVGILAGWRAAFIYVVPGLTIATGAAALFPSNAWWAALVLGVVASLVGLSAARGLNNVLLVIPIALGFEIADPPSVNVSIPIPLFVALVVLFTTVFGSTVVYLVSRHKPAPKDLVSVSKLRAQYFALVLGPFIALAAWCVVHFNLGHAGSWMILTILVIYKPFIQDGIKKAASRTVGTIGGFVVAIALAQVTTSEFVFYIVGVIAMVAALTFMLNGRPYWEYAVALTIAIVMMEGATNLVTTAETRLVATLLGAGASLVVMLLLRPFAIRATKTAGATHY